MTSNEKWRRGRDQGLSGAGDHGERIKVLDGDGIAAEVVLFLTRPLSFMIWGGVFERFPELEVAITEGTGIWVPEYLKLHDQRYEVTHYSQKLGDYRSPLSMKPSEY